MNRNTFLKKFFGFVGIATVATTVKVKPEAPPTPIDGFLKTNQLHITDGTCTYELVVENEKLHIRKIVPDIKPEESLPTNTNGFLVRPHSFQISL